MKLSLVVAQLGLAASAAAQVMDTPRFPGGRGVVAASRPQPRQTAPSGRSSWPYGPFSTRGRDIVNSRGEVMQFAGLNWPMSGISQPSSP